LAKTIAIAAGRTAANDSDSAKHEIWLGDLDSNQDCSVQSREFYR
jgi:hypothetical protein